MNNQSDPDSFHPSDYIEDPELDQICDECGSSGTCFKTCSFVTDEYPDDREINEFYTGD